MGALELLLYQTRRHFISRLLSVQSCALSFSIPPIPLSSSTSIGYYRRFCSSLPGSGIEDPRTPPKEPGKDPVESELIQDGTNPVSSEKDSSKSEQRLPHFLHPKDTVPLASSNVRDRNFTREDFRYPMGVSSISPVSYQKKKAPFPELKVEESPVEKENELRDVTELLQREERKNEGDNRTIQQFNQPPVMVPFPLLIRVPRRKTKERFDLFRAIQEVKFTSKKKKWDTVEAHVNLNVEVSRSDMLVRGTVKFPHSTGKVVKVMVFAEGEAAKEAHAAGADIVGGPELVEEIREKKTFKSVDRVICTISFMDQLKKIGIILRNMMPNQKKGTLTDNVAKAVKESKKGLIDFKMDSNGIVHLVVGKVRFAEEALVDNVAALMSAILLAKPPAFEKGRFKYVKSFYLCSHNGPSVLVSLESLLEAAGRHDKQQKLRVPVDNMRRKGSN